MGRCKVTCPIDGHIRRTVSRTGKLQGWYIQGGGCPMQIWCYCSGMRPCWPTLDVEFSVATKRRWTMTTMKRAHFLWLIYWQYEASFLLADPLLIDPPRRCCNQRQNIHTYTAWWDEVRSSLLWPCSPSPACRDCWCQWHDIPVPRQMAFRRSCHSTS